MTNPEEVKAKFYKELHTIVATVLKADKFITLGDFNARLSSDNVSWDGVVGKHSVGHNNTNDLLLLQTCTDHELLITNTLFYLPNRNRTS